MDFSKFQSDSTYMPGVMMNEVELLEELPYYRTLQKPPGSHHPPPPPPQLHPHYPTAPRGRARDHHPDDTAIAIIAPDMRAPAPHAANFEGGGRYAPPPPLELALSVVGYVGDAAAAAAAAYLLLSERRALWAALSAAFLLVAAVAVNALSLCWYVRARAAPYAAVGKATWAARALFHLCLMGLLYRYLRLLVTSACGDRVLEDREHRSVMEARKRKNALLQLSMREDKQAAALGLLHTLLESAPQLVLQLYALAHRTDADSQTVVVVQGACAAASLFHLAWSITAYNCTLHRAGGKRRQRAAAPLLHFLWHFCTVGSRACTLALFTKEYHFWLFPFCIGHWGVMAIWVMHQQTRLCPRGPRGQTRQCREYLADMGVGVAYVIYYLNVKAEPTRYKYSAYYAIVFAENCALMTLWFLRNDPAAWYHIPALVAVFSSFASGVVFMLFYYGFCHRTFKQSNEKRAAHCC